MKGKFAAPIKYSTIKRTYYYTSQDWDSAMFDKKKQIGIALELLERMKQLQSDYSLFLETLTILK